MGRVLILLYGVVAYLAFLFSFLYAIGFVGNFRIGDFALPKTIDSGEPGPVGASILINVALLSVFAIQHTIMARQSFKRWWTKIIPAAAERSTFVLVSSVILLGIFWLWQPMTSVVWHVEQSAVRAILIGLSLLGWATVVFGSFLIDHFDLFGLRQVVLHFQGKPYTYPRFVVRSLYRVVRHPLMVGFIVAFWSTPTMTTGHLLFAAVTTGYIVFGITIEERDLVRYFGDDYRRYRERTRALIPLPKRPPATAASD